LSRKKNQIASQSRAGRGRWARDLLRSRRKPVPKSEFFSSLLGDACKRAKGVEFESRVDIHTMLWEKFIAGSAFSGATALLREPSVRSCPTTKHRFLRCSSWMRFGGCQGIRHRPCGRILAMLRCRYGKASPQRVADPWRSTSTREDRLRSNGYRVASTNSRSTMVSQHRHIRRPIAAFYCFLRARLRGGSSDEHPCVLSRPIWVKYSGTVRSAGGPISPR